MGAVVKSRKGLGGVERGKRFVIPVERKRPVFEGRPVQFSSMRVMIVKNRHSKPLHPLSHQ